MATPRKLRCTVSEIIEHGEGVRTLRLTPEKPLPSFQAGQFLQLAIDAYDPSGFWPDSRAFSIASSPHQRDLLEIVYSVVGYFTEKMAKELKPGSEVWVKLPHGEFVVEGDASDVVLIGGGTGISPFVPFIREFVERTEMESRVHVLYGARRPEFLIYQKEFARAAAKCSKLDVCCFAETGAAEGIQQGRLSVQAAIERVERSGGSWSSAVYYLSGPPAMIKSFAKELAERGVPAANIRVDAWE